MIARDCLLVIAHDCSCASVSLCPRLVADFLVRFLKIADPTPDRFLWDQLKALRDGSEQRLECRTLLITCSGLGQVAPPHAGWVYCLGLWGMVRPFSATPNEPSAP